MRSVINPLHETKPLYETAVELLGEIEERQVAGGVDLIGLPTGFETLDYILGGWRNDEMYSVGGATGSGKSSYCLSTARTVAKQGGSVFYLSLEMSAKLLALRTLSAMTGLPAMKVEKGLLSEVSMKELRHAVETFKDLPLYFFDRSTTSVDLATILSEQKNRRGLDFVIVDYIALLQDQGKSPYEKITEISKNLRGHARDFDIPLIAVSQLNRASLNREGGRPQLQDLKESGQIENDSGAVIFPFRPKVENEEEDRNPDVESAELIVAKNRHGPANVTFPVEFLPKQMVWREAGGPIINPPTAERENRSIA